MDGPVWHGSAAKGTLDAVVSLLNKMDAKHVDRNLNPVLFLSAILSRGSLQTVQEH